MTALWGTLPRPLLRRCSGPSNEELSETSLARKAAISAELASSGSSSLAAVDCLKRRGQSHFPDLRDELSGVDRIDPVAKGLPLIETSALSLADHRTANGPHARHLAEPLLRPRELPQRRVQPHGVDREDPEVGDRDCGEVELQGLVWQEHVLAPRRARVAWAASVERATLMADVHGAARRKLPRREDLGLEIAGEVDE
eukprot:scaffold2493_cov62-Phaeocystis_antarctica.AAC.4